MKYSLFAGNRWFGRLITYPCTKKYYVTLIAVMLLAGIWHTMIYRPVNRTIRYYERLNNQLREQYCKLEQDRILVEKLTSTISTLKKDIVGYQSVNRDTDFVLSNLIELTATQHIRFDSCVVETLIDRGWYKVQPINLTISGSVDQIAAYVQSLSTAQSMCYIPQINMTCSEDKGMRCQLLVCHMKIS